MQLELSKQIGEHELRELELSNSQLDLEKLDYKGSLTQLDEAELELE